MAKLNALYLSHIKKVNVGFVITGVNLDPQFISEKLKIFPDSCALKGEDQKNFAGNIIGKYDEGFWRINTEKKIKSLDINKHFEYLFKVLRPHKEFIFNHSKINETFFDVIWKSSNLYSGSGPILTGTTVDEISKLKAGIYFDIYQEDDEEDS